jgi:hypothetical protein
VTIQEAQELDRASAAVLSLASMMQREPLQSIQENPRQWTLRATNYTLLCALLSQIPEDSRRLVFESALLRVRSDPACARTTRAVRNWRGLVSELPLVAEFCVRNGARQEFLQALRDAIPLPGHAILLRHIEDMIAFNFVIFSDEDYEQLSLCVVKFRETAVQRYPKPRSGPFRNASEASRFADERAFFQEIVDSTQRVGEKCREARYLYLKASLLENLNLEINQDKEAVQRYLRSLGFRKELARSLDEATRLYEEGGDEFSLKASMGHIRSSLRICIRTRCQRSTSGLLVPSPRSGVLGSHTFGRITSFRTRRGDLLRA